jgi:molybdopterin-guanine dinucleotide biosynthesis protein A
MRSNADGPVGVILAGGAGSRLGGAKAMVMLDGEPLIAFGLRALRAVVSEVAVVVRPDTTLPRLPPGVERWDEPDELTRHPLNGVRHALERAAGRPVLVLAVDLPLVSPQTLRRLAICAPASAVVRAEGRLEPLCALYGAGAHAVLGAADPAARATDVVAALDPQLIDVEGDIELLNVNDAADLTRADAILRSVRVARNSG